MRVIAGALGGRRLRAPRGRATRPTPDRVREAMFAALGPIDGCRVLDLYAGTGALAIEALSRGASTAVVVERSASVLRVLEDNVRSLELMQRIRLVRCPVERATEAIARLGPFDLVLADPPYEAVAGAELPRTLRELLATPGILAAEARLVLEHATRTDAPELEPLRRARSRPYGDTTLSFYEASASVDPGGEEADRGHTPGAPREVW